MARILIMEDDAAVAFELSDLLSVNGHDVEWHRSAAEARIALTDSEFDLLISDIYVFRDGEVIPDGGISLIGWIRMAARSPEHKRLRNLPIIAISGATHLPGNEVILKVAESVGATCSFEKPIPDDKLLEKIGELV